MVFETAVSVLNPALGNRCKPFFSLNVKNLSYCLNDKAEQHNHSSLLRCAHRHWDRNTCGHASRTQKPTDWESATILREAEGGRKTWGIMLLEDEA
eukprot:354616-Chlamydomonas_euryale.AAC.4